jgi:phosphomannomutase
MMPRLLEALGCRVFTVDSEPTGIFSRNPEPVPQNLRSLGKLVRSSRAVVGFAVDPDADRLALVGADGRPLGEEGTLVLALQRLLAFKQGPVVVNLSTSMATEEVARRFGVKHYRTPVGEVHVARTMKRLGAAGGGEGNGGVLHPGLHLGRDAPVAAALILALMAERGADPGRILGEMTPTFMVKIKVEFPRGRLPRLLERLPRQLRGARLDRRDGLRLTWPDRWLHVRGSGTEPIVRIIAEADSARAVRELAAEAEEAARKVARS